MITLPARDTLYRVGAALLIERPNRTASIADLADRLERSGQALAERFAGAPSSPENRALLAHIIGLERWGQRRLEIAAGKPYLRDEMDRYVPDDAALPALVATFQQTRAATVALARQLQAAGADLDAPIPHNQFLWLSVRGWLAYLEVHARLETFKLRR